jgi:hypothetical protein
MKQNQHWTKKLLKKILMSQLLVYNRHGQSAARGPHAALELKIFDSPLTII